MNVANGEWDPTVLTWLDGVRQHPVQAYQTELVAPDGYRIWQRRPGNTRPKHPSSLWRRDGFMETGYIIS